MPKVINLLEERRKEKGLTHVDMSRILNISLRQWDYVRFGKRNFGLHSYMMVMKAYPDLIPDIIEEMSERGLESNKGGDDARV